MWFKAKNKAAMAKLQELINATGKTGEIVQGLVELQEQMDRAFKARIEALDERVKALETCDITDQNIYRTVEDLKNRVPKGSAVSDFRFNELAGTVSRLERLISEMNAAWANAKREQELYLEERRVKTTVSRAVKELT